MSDEVNNALVGSLVGLGLGALTRKLVAGKQDVSWKDYALWGGVGAGVGGAAGYGLTGIDPSKPTEQMVSAAKTKVDEAAQKLKEVEEEAKASALGAGPGLLQMFSPSEWAFHGGLSLGAGLLWRRVPKVKISTKADIAEIPAIRDLRTKLVDAKNALARVKNKRSKHYGNLKDRVRVAERNLKRSTDIELALATPWRKTKIGFGIARNILPWLFHAGNWGYAAWNSRNFKDWWEDGSWSYSNPKYGEIQDAKEALEEATAERMRIQRDADD